MCDNGGFRVYPQSMFIINQCTSHALQLQVRDASTVVMLLCDCVLYCSMNDVYRSHYKAQLTMILSFVSLILKIPHATHR